VRQAFGDNDLIDTLDSRMLTRPRQPREEFARWKSDVDAYCRLGRDSTRARAKTLA
jgi:hypothetical protein